MSKKFFRALWIIVSVVAVFSMVFLTILPALF